MFKQFTALLGKGQDRGFTLIEMLIVILIIGILAAVGVPLYIGYTRDAKLAEGKALAGSVLTTFQACAQTDTTGNSCTLSNLSSKVGLSSGGISGDGRWTVTATAVTLSTGNAGSAATWAGGPITVTGSGTDNNGLVAQISVANGGVITMTCDTGQGFNPC